MSGKEANYHVLNCLFLSNQQLKTVVTALWMSCLTCPAQVALDHVKLLLDPALHVIKVVQRQSQRAVHALQFVHQVCVVLRRLVLVMQELQHTVV